MPAVARELDLPVVGVQAAGAGAAGGIAAAPIYLAGDVQLDYLPPEQRFTLMTGLQLAGLSVPSPACSGILGRAFIDCFEAVELRFAGASSSSGSSDGGGSSGSSSSSDGVSNGGELSEGSSSGSSGQAADGAAAQDGAVASGSVGAAAAAGSSGGASAAAGVVSSGGSGYELRLHAQYVPPEKEQEVDGKGGLTRVPLQLLGETGLWGVQMRVSRPSDAGDGPGAQDAVVMVRALVDTGAPMTILNTAAAEALGLGAGPAPPPPPAPKPAGLFGAIGKLLSGGGGGGPQLQGAVGGLRRLEKELELSVACDAEGGWTPMGAVRPMVGDLPGFAALGVAAGQPGAILGLDALTRVSAVVLLPKGGPAMLLGAPVEGAPEWA